MEFKAGVFPEVDPSAFTHVAGVATDPGSMGVIGSNTDDNAFGFLGGNDLVFHQHAGVYGQSDQQGVMGIGTTDMSTGVFGGNKDGAGFGVRGETKTGVAVQGRSFGAGLAGSFIGDVQVTGELNVDRLQLNGINLQQRIADLEANGINLQQRVADLEALVGKLIGFMDRTNEHPPARFDPNISLTLSGGTLFGDGFLPGTFLTIRIISANLGRSEKQSLFPTDGGGAFQFDLERIFPGTSIRSVAVTDGRSNPLDWTGLLWATPNGG